MNYEKNRNKVFPNDGKCEKKNFQKKKGLYRPVNRRRIVEQQGCCQACRSKTGLAAHHIVFRTDGIDDSFVNLLTLCFDCHRKAHDGYYVIKNYDGIERIVSYITAKEFIIMVLKRLNQSIYQLVIERLENEI